MHKYFKIPRIPSDFHILFYGFSDGFVIVVVGIGCSVLSGVAVVSLGSIVVSTSIIPSVVFEFISGSTGLSSESLLSSGDCSPFKILMISSKSMSNELGGGPEADGGMPNPKDGPLGGPLGNGDDPKVLKSNDGGPPKGKLPEKVEKMESGAG